MHRTHSFTIFAIIDYLAAGRLLHLITAGQLLILLGVCWMGAGSGQPVCLALLAVVLAGTQLDARSRYQEYKKARDQLMRHGPDTRIFRSLSRSRCQRDAVLAAARQLGHGRACRQWFIDAGYRWYHLLPDFVQHQPQRLLSAAFLRATFLAPTYRSIGRNRAPGATACEEHAVCA